MRRQLVRGQIKHTKTRRSVRAVPLQAAALDAPTCARQFRGMARARDTPQITPDILLRAYPIALFPLAIATGPGANGRIAIGTAVIGGMMTATILALFYIPLFYVLVRRGVRDGFTIIRERLRRRRGAEA